MDWVPRFKLYDSTGNTLLYTFEVVQRTNAPQSPRRSVEITGQRGKGSIILDGGTEAWNLYIEGILDGDDYEALTQKIDELESALQPNTAYILRIDKTQSTYYEYKVKRILAIDYPESLRNENEWQRYTVILRVNCW